MNYQHLSSNKLNKHYQLFSSPILDQQPCKLTSKSTFSFKKLFNLGFEKLFNKKLRVHLKIDEKINLTCGKDGGVQNLEVLGVLSVRIGSEDDGRIKIALRNSDSRNLQLQTNPNVDKNLFKNNSVIGLRDSTKSFPINTDIGVLKWRFQTTEETEIPLSSKHIKFYQ